MAMVVPRIKTIIRRLYLQIVAFHPFGGWLLRFFRTFFILVPLHYLLPLRKKVYVSKHMHCMDNRYISFSYTNEGVGSVMGRYVAAMILSRLLKLKFLHRPILDMRDSKLDWEEFLGFGNRELKFNHIADNRSLKVISLPEMIRIGRFDLKVINRIVNHLHKNEDAIFMTSSYTSLSMRAFPTCSKSVYNTLKYKYWQNKRTNPFKSNFAQGKVKVACCIRRDELVRLKSTNHWQARLRWIDNTWYSNILNRLIVVFGDDIDIHVYSDGHKPEEFKGIIELPYLTLHLKEDEPLQPFYAFHSFISADIFVSAISAFANQASLLSDNIIIYPQFVGWRNRIKPANWLEADKTGHFDTAKVKFLYSLRKKEKGS